MFLYERFKKGSPKEKKMLKKVFSWFNLEYQSVIDSYISARNPQNNADVERLQREFERLSQSARY